MFRPREINWEGKDLLPEFREDEIVGLCSYCECVWVQRREASVVGATILGRLKGGKYVPRS